MISLQNLTEGHFGGEVWMWIRRNPNPKKKEAPDCVIRAISIALGLRWYDVYDALCAVGRDECNMPSADAVWGRYLYSLGFKPFLLPEHCPKCITIKRFCVMFPHGTFVIGTGSHAVAVIDGNYYDSWDSGEEVPSFFWRIK
jgi:hypothetical protein